MSPRRREAPPGPTATAQLAEALRREILGSRLAPGEALREEQLAARTGHSRHTVRSALRLLADERLLTLAPYRGARVSALDAEDLRGLQQLRCALESEAVRISRERHGTVWPRQVTAPVVAAIGELARVGESLPGDWPAVAVAHAGVHQALVDTAGSGRLSAAHARLRSELLLVLVHVRPAYSVDALVAEHVDHLVQVQEQGERAVRAHLAHATEIILGGPEAGSP